MDDNLFIKIIVIGDQGVGKTSLLNQYCYNKFDPTIPATVGCDFTTKVYNNFKERTIRLQLWDIAGQERFQAVSKLYVRGAYGCVIVTDINDRSSYDSITKWKEMVEQNCDYYDNRPIPIILVQNKIDLLSKETAQIEDFQNLKFMEDFVKTNGLFSVVQTSAKTNKNLKEVFESLTEEILRRNMINDDPVNFHSEMKKSVMKVNKDQEENKQQKRKNGGCC